MLKGKTIVLGISGGIAAYKAASLCSKLAQAGASVHVIMTESAAKFIQPLTLQTLSRNPVIIDIFDEEDAAVVSHIDLADRADLVLVAPATANMIAKMAHGLADDMLSTTLLATTAPIMVAPAMNVHMYAHPAVQQNMKTLQQRGIQFVSPGTGQLACGYVGEGRLAEPETIFDVVEQHFLTFNSSSQLLQGKRVLVTAGGTLERIDPVRYITNDSSGKMGFALAETASRMGADVVLVSANTHLSLPEGVENVSVETTEEMYQAVLNRYEKMDIVIKAAAVSDYRPVQQYKQKIKKSDDSITITFQKNPDILKKLGELKTHQFLIGFAAETNNVEHYALEKLKNKNCDMLVANDVTLPGAGFGTDTNKVSLYDKMGLIEELPLLSKEQISEQILKITASKLS
ncbi:bifunctional phosphopantothenoylcysteine decarboxylase/phosphopantothenate--cysteine ligase CoaBC [Chengkuizengella axinellae]|uniref:Coenzyme A biosynthesis bifunctional protein CoaBC n=1 Tax=Chengkuizengella axinellae TaxID=3064388 RepID=A0ABT9IW81_9BACL|nr:bifunctional phosphopantothenoylcysteine decarboxylase/phosphopantothenate--cysteine ligase CoaBC [Chengkuizengella sp. 2205SS18-9]MDP5273362.1 bifunctional phosphopantothenoylcysteine decarboxylase/phosphopantothenate--cysteine ligase CoaBC [Chengkuizengella sp. 2205SS18-9]